MHSHKTKREGNPSAVTSVTAFTLGPSRISSSHTFMTTASAAGLMGPEQLPLVSLSIGFLNLLCYLRLGFLTSKGKANRPQDSRCKDPGIQRQHPNGGMRPEASIMSLTEEMEPRIKKANPISIITKQRPMITDRNPLGSHAFNLV